MLSLDGNRLTSLPPEIGHLAHLSSLMLMGNQLTSLPPEMGMLVNLRFLAINRNRLTSRRPPEIRQLPNLNEVTLDNPLIILRRRIALRLRR